ncbi:MAG: domain protein putative component of TonB system [Myxococcaceae bacterium]|nr:domain protein putative component of TonB system [Myxococcaceae bacterium]
MTMRVKAKVRSVVGAALCVFAVAGCSRNNIEAVNLSNEADKSRGGNLDDAISKYEQATTLDPTNHRILWKLATAYQKKEAWDKVTTTLTKAQKLAPTYANIAPTNVDGGAGAGGQDDAGAGGGAGSSDAGASDGGASNEASSSDETSGCSVAPNPKARGAGSAGALLFALATLAAFARRKRRRHFAIVAPHAAIAVNEG